jgi:hypothetical protein
LKFSFFPIFAQIGGSSLIARRAHPRFWPHLRSPKSCREPAFSAPFARERA